MGRQSQPSNPCVKGKVLHARSLERRTHFNQQCKTTIEVVDFYTSQKLYDPHIHTYGGWWGGGQVPHPFSQLLFGSHSLFITTNECKLLPDVLGMRSVHTLHRPNTQEGLIGIHMYLERPWKYTPRFWFSWTAPSILTFS
jgi:hypothetical protein